MRYIGCPTGRRRSPKPSALPPEPGPIRHPSGVYRSPVTISSGKSFPVRTEKSACSWSPLAGGLLSGKFSRTNQKPADARRTDYDFPLVDKERAWKILAVMAPIASAHGCSPARVSLAWLLAKPVVTSVIIGAKRLDQLQDNLAAVELTLTRDELTQLDEVSALPPEYPGWVLPFQGADRLGPVDRWERLREASEPH